MRIVTICIVVAALSLAAILFLEDDPAKHPEPAARSGADSTGAQPAEYAPSTRTDREPALAAESPAGDHPVAESAVTAALDTIPPSAPAATDAASGTTDQVHWGYHGPYGPANWGELLPEYALCGAGRNQSPVNLTGFIEAELPPLTINYAGMVIDLRNNGHTVQADYHPGSSLVVDGRIFHLKQFHFHAPSENLLNGRAYPLEVHFVHSDDHGNLAVVAVLFQTGEENRSLSKLWDQLPEHAGTSRILAAQVRADELLPDDRDYYRYNGSLTTPPCSQGVLWLVMKQTPSVSTEQVETFTAAIGGPNNRPVQPLNARVVLQ